MQFTAINAERAGFAVINERVNYVQSYASSDRLNGGHGADGVTEPTVRTETIAVHLRTLDSQHVTCLRYHLHLFTAFVTTVGQVSVEVVTIAQVWEVGTVARTQVQ
ncbi:MAG: hypothetical protein [Bacteriophage sp.]|jgi:hypothetical protein|nr:MAG: hypothetical protein [Bacteriophage sp.]